MNIKKIMVVFGAICASTLFAAHEDELKAGNDLVPFTHELNVTTTDGYKLTGKLEINYLNAREADFAGTIHAVKMTRSGVPVYDGFPFSAQVKDSVVDLTRDEIIASIDDHFKTHDLQFFSPRIVADPDSLVESIRRQFLAAGLKDPVDNSNK